MRRRIRYHIGDQEYESTVSYIPFRYYIAIALAVLETVAVIGIVIALSYYAPYFYLAVWATQIGCVVLVCASDENPDYKVPWLIVLMCVPIAGFMCYILFYNRMLKKKYTRRMTDLKEHSYARDDTALLERLKEENITAHNQAKMLCDIAETHLFTHTSQEYFPLGEELFERMAEDLRNAKKFIFMEYFIIEEGQFWNTILEILKEKAQNGVEVKVLYDDVGCMTTLPGNYYKILRSYGIEAAPFSMLRGNADSGEFNNRSHRKILSIDGEIGYTGGINLADEYINVIEKHGHWKDVGIRLEGEAVKELTKLFLIDFGTNVKAAPVISNLYFPDTAAQPEDGYLIPFGDGPSPVYQHRVGKSVIQNMLNQASRYVYITTPYLIIDNDLCQSIENAARRGVDVKIITPHVPDKWLILEMTRSYYHRLMQAGVEIYEYGPGFIHAKTYVADDEYAMIGTINLDYRSLVHHFENGVWMYRCESIAAIKRDIQDTLSLSIRMEDKQPTFPVRVLCSLVRIFAPML